MDVRRLGPRECEIGVEAVRLLKAPEGYPVPSTEYMSRFLYRPENVLIVAVDNGIPVGFVVAYLLDRVDRDQQMIFLSEVGVAETHRQRGIGRRMIERLKIVCRCGNVMKMWVPTGRSNVAATRLYASTGAAAISGDDEVTYTYPRESFMPMRPATFSSAGRPPRRPAEAPPATSRRN